MTDQEKAKAREREAKVALLAKELYLFSFASPAPMTQLAAFQYAEDYWDLDQERWEALK